MDYSPPRIAVRPEPGTPVPSSALSPEPLDIWKSEIRELKACADLWDSDRRRGLAKHEEILERKLAAGLARAPFHLAAAREKRIGLPDYACHRPANLRAALWQRFAVARSGPDLLQCARWSRAHMWPLVSQGRGLQKRSAVLLGYTAGSARSDADDEKARLTARGRLDPPLFATQPCVFLCIREVPARSVASRQSPEDLRKSGSVTAPVSRLTSTFDSRIRQMA